VQIDRGSVNINRLIAEGEKAAAKFLSDRPAAIAAASTRPPATLGEINIA